MESGEVDGTVTESELAGCSRLSNAASESEAESDKTLLNAEKDDDDRTFEKARKYFADCGIFDGEQLTKAQTALVLMSFSYGSAVIILPNTLLKLGPVSWTLFIAIVIIIIAYCTYLNSQSTRYLIGQVKTADTLRDPYPAIAELAGGNLFRKVTIVVMHVAMITNALGFVLLAATLMENAITFPWFDRYNAIRVWTCILSVIMTPLMFVGNLADLSGAATFAVTASSVSLVAIFINCMLCRFHYNIQSDYIYTRRIPSIINGDIFVTFGLFTFAASGPSFAVPNVITHVKQVEKFPSIIVTVFCCLFFLYAFSGTIPYVVFGDHTMESVTASFAAFEDSNVVYTFTLVSDVSMSMHLLLEAILIMNPVYQHVEDVFSIPREMNWKRVLVRTCGVLFIFFTAIAFPAFRSVLSIIGGVPLTLVGVIFPIIIHTKIFENGMVTNALHLGILVFFSVFMIGNFGVTLEMLTYSALASIKAS